jgi:hypothetical protein
MTGTFAKLGISRLSIATILRTCFFAVTGFSGIPKQNTFLDLAKLTLAAFIGSFVQRQTDETGIPANFGVSDRRFRRKAAAGFG